MELATRAIRHAALRHGLKVTFPGVKFSVRGSRGTGYGWTHVTWTDGPTEQQVSGVCEQYFGSRFNGMHDGYDSTGNTFWWGGVQYRAGGSGYLTQRNRSQA